ncbi:hypothetical protein HNR21_004065 [Actinomadura cellulosilytica]|uniref:Transglycosylase SLT domain-containing protein n=1 Tax=Thermomonospora cellulosilytica TaxID=1411118 RepID=A0A7W3N0B5_9ACTN|nr:hypothetical protein [Thermomonospora cellulosilytica]
MTPQELEGVRTRLEEFAAEVFAPFARVDQRWWAQAYVRGCWGPVAASRWSRRRRRGVHRSRSVRVDLTEEEYAAVRDAAARERFAVSAYAGQVLVAVAQGGHAPEFVPLRELMRHLLQASGQVRRIGINLNQAVAALHSLGKPTGALRSGENHAGAGGPMQFLAATWAAYGVDANGDGRAHRAQPPDRQPPADPPPGQRRTARSRVPHGRRMGRRWRRLPGLPAQRPLVRTPRGIHRMALT